jgi:hypothetical protein
MFGKVEIDFIKEMVDYTSTRHLTIITDGNECLWEANGV